VGVEAPVERDILDSPAAGPKAIRGSALRVLGYAAGSLLALAGAAGVFRHLGADDFGRYAAIFSLAAVALGVVDLGTATIGVREFSVRRRDDALAFLSALLGLRLVLALAGFAGVVGVAAVAGYDGEQVAGAVGAGAGVALAVAAGTLLVPLQAHLRLGWVTALDLLRQAATVVALVVLVAAGAGIVPLLSVTVPVGVLLLVATAAVLRGGERVRPRVDREAWRRLMAMAIPYGAATGAAVIYANIAVVLLSLAATERETGLFSAAFRVYFVIGTVPGLLVQSAFPILARAARDDDARLRYGVQRLLDACLLLGVGVALVTAVGAPVAIEIVAGPGYEGAEDALRILALAMLGTFVLAVGGFALASLGRFRALLWTNAVALGLAVVLTLALAGPLGERAGSLALVAGDFALAALYFALLARDGVRPGWGTGVKALLAAVPAGALVLALGLPALPAAIVAGLVFAALLVPLRAVPPELAELLPARLRGRA
jgi:O-antigen/teichoic acid export membrane protein